MKGNFKKKLLTAISLCIFLPGLLAAHAASNAITVTINDSYVKFDQPPMMINGRVMVPLRAIFEGLGASVSYNSANKTITGEKDGTIVRLALKSATASINGKSVTLDVPANAINGRVLVPTRFIAESLGANVDWKSSQKLVAVKTDTKDTMDTGNIPGIVDLISASSNTKKISNTDIDNEIIYTAGKNGEDSLYVAIPAGALRQSSTLTIKPTLPSGLNPAIVTPLLSDDVTIAEQSQFSKKLIIEFPYKKSLLNPGYADRDQLLAAYYDTTAREWKLIPYEVDPSTMVVRVKTDHLTEIMIARTNPETNNVSTPANAQKVLAQAASGKAKQIPDLHSYEAVYQTKHFTVKFNIQEEKDMTAKGFTYIDWAYDESQYPKVEYGKNFYLQYNNDQMSPALIKNVLGLDEAQISALLPRRIKEFAMIAEAVYSKYEQSFRPISDPITIRIIPEGSPKVTKYQNHMELSLDHIDRPSDVWVTVGHEVFHMVQRMYANPLDMAKNEWLMEATAEYAGFKLAPPSPMPISGRAVNMEYFRTKLGTVEGLLWSRGSHEYKSSKFIEYLVKNYGLNLSDMFNHYSNQIMVNDFQFLEDYMKTKKPGFILGKAYLDFASYMMFDTAGDLSTTDMYAESYKLSFNGGRVYRDLSLFDSYVPNISAVRIEIPDKEKRMVIVKAESPDLGLGVNAYLLKSNSKSAYIKPILELASEKEKFTTVEVEKGDIIYFVAGNSALNDPNATKYTMKGRVSVEDSAISVKREYSNITRTTKTVKLTAEGKSLENPANFDFKWTISSDRGTVINLNDPKSASFSGASMTVNLIHENPVEVMDTSDLNGSTNPFGGSDPFDVIIKNIDDGTNYTIGLKITDKNTGSEIYSTTIFETVGLKSPLISVGNP